MAFYCLCRKLSDQSIWSNKSGSWVNLGTGQPTDAMFGRQGMTTQPTAANMAALISADMDKRVELLLWKPPGSVTVTMTDSSATNMGSLNKFEFIVDTSQITNITSAEVF